jgi:hypothetical protein
MIAQREKWNLGETDRAMKIMAECGQDYGANMYYDRTREDSEEIKSNLRT